MKTPGYRSYVIRAWTRGGAESALTRVEIERVDSGERVDLRGDAARRLAASIEAAIGASALGKATGEGTDAGPARQVLTRGSRHG